MEKQWIGIVDLPYSSEKIIVNAMNVLLFRQDIFLFSFRAFDFPGGKHKTFIFTHPFTNPFKTIIR